MGILEVYKKIVRKVINKTFPFWQLLGFHITPVHFYQPMPDTRKLTKELWQKESQLIGINLREHDQISLLSVFIEKYKQEYDVLLKDAIFKNSEFRSTDAEILYCMIRYLKPKKIIEIGSGCSTLIMIDAILKNKQEYMSDCVLVSIDPYPKKFIEQGLPSFFKLIKQEVQNVGLDEFGSLDANDILFIDSSHMLKIGSDVQYEFLEILPRLHQGVVIHIHDIFLPVEYPKNWVVKERLFFNEQYLLQAFLIFNKEFEVLWAGSYMHLKKSELLKKAFDSYDPQIVWPGSFWIKRM